MTDSQEDHAAAPDRVSGGTATIARAIALAMFGVIVIAVWILVPLPSVEEVRAFVDGLGPVGGIVLALAYAAITLTPAPKNVLTVAAGLAFGFWQALLWVYLGALLGAAAAFVLSRRLGREAVERYTGARVERFDELVRRRGLVAMIGVRLVPILPFTAINYLAGLSAVRRRDYALGTAIGIVPGTVAYIAVGAFGLDAGWQAWAAIGGLVVLTLAGGAVALVRRRRGRDARAAAATASGHPAPAAAASPATPPQEA
ncbi:TVP38/TMEM64 family protein [Microcella daejeonensis]|uniref:TVP38/TMEM64 family protein n=1 Tax=Microcella daejeonensis TaxID=2994971 RepID=UPI0022722540|nr:TVP38/TMEM64 family protein [Microcella daejeonensis]WAB82970.1 TVP38/TMEM64 family protein [Microcella daejeonensis]